MRCFGLRVAGCRSSVVGFTFFIGIAILAWSGDGQALGTDRQLGKPSVGQEGRVERHLPEDDLRLLNPAIGQPGGESLRNPETGRDTVALNGPLWEMKGWPIGGMAAGGPAQPERGEESPDRPVDQPANRPAGGSAVPGYRLGTAREETSLAWDGVRLVLTLAAILLLLGLGAAVLRRWPGLAPRGGAAGGLQILGRVALTPKEAICLVRAGAEILVVGVSPSGVTLLHRMEAGAAESIRTAQASSALRGMSAAPPSGFRLRELTARVRQVQAAWGWDQAGSKGER